MTSSDDQEVLRATQALLDAVAPTTPTFARQGATSRDIVELARAAGAEIHYFPFTSSAAGMAYPKVSGIIPIFVDAASTRADQMLTALHELAHAWRGEIDEPTYLTAADTFSNSERVADLFAILGLAPTNWMRFYVGRRHRTVRMMTLEVVQAYRELTEGWSEQRLWDRARLRVMLYREYGI